MYEFQSDDYIYFHRIIRPESKVSFSTDYKTGRPIANPQIPEQVLPQRGQGQIIKLAKAKRKVRNLKTNEMERFTVARVASGQGVVTAILDDATLMAKPLTMDLGIEHVDPKDIGPSQYGTDAKGLA